MDLNKVIVAGRMTADPELKTLPSGSDVANFNLALNRRWTDESGEKKEEVCFIGVKVFGKRAATIQKFFRKGSNILVEGRLRQESWEKDGQKHSKHVVLLDSFSFVDSKSSRDDNQRQAPEGAEFIPGD